MTETKKKLIVKSHRDEIYNIESFIEEICDDYNIFNSYFSNILISAVEGFEIIINHIEKGKIDRRNITILFTSGKDGLKFEITSPIEIFDKKFLIDSLDNVDKDIQDSYLKIKYLSDEVNISEDRKSCEIVFYISSINFDKTIERQNLLENYFNIINISKKV